MWFQPQLTLAQVLRLVQLLGARRRHSLEKRCKVEQKVHHVFQGKKSGMETLMLSLHLQKVAIKKWRDGGEKTKKSLLESLD